MFVRLRFHPTQRKKRNLGPSRAPTMKDAWFTLSQERCCSGLPAELQFMSCPHVDVNPALSPHSSDDLYAYLTHWRPDVCILEGGQEEEDEDEEFVLVDSREPEACQGEARAGDEWEVRGLAAGGPTPGQLRSALRGVCAQRLQSGSEWRLRSG